MGDTGTNRKTVGILIFDDVEVLDFCGPFEVFSVTRLDEENRREEPSPFEVKLIAQTEDVVTTTGGMRVMPDFVLEDCPKLDILLVPGGYGTRRESGNEALLEWISARAGEVGTLASVCTGSMLLGEANLLKGLRATTHWQSLDRMRDAFPNVTVVRDEHFVEAGDVMTSAGISAGIELALRLVAKYHGEEVARNTARYMEYPYPEGNARRI